MGLKGGPKHALQILAVTRLEHSDRSVAENVIHADDTVDTASQEEPLDERGAGAASDRAHMLFVVVGERRWVEHFDIRLSVENRLHIHFSFTFVLCVSLNLFPDFVDGLD